MWTQKVFELDPFDVMGSYLESDKLAYSSDAERNGLLSIAQLLLALQHGELLFELQNLLVLVLDNLIF